MRIGHGSPTSQKADAVQHAPIDECESEQLQLSVLTADDVTDRYVGWLNDPLVNRFLECRHVRQTLGLVRSYVLSNEAAPNMALLGIRTLADNTHIGNVRIVVNAGHRLGEIGVLIGDRRAWGRGFAPQAIRLATRMAFQQFDLRKFSAGVYGTNQSSIRAFEKAGFRVECRRQNHLLLGERADDLVLMALYAPTS